MSKVMVFDHPLIQHKVGLLRDKNTAHKLFRELLEEVSMLMAYEVTRDLELVDVEIDTPMQPATVKQLKDDQISIVPILRAGLGMVDGLLNLLPNAKVGFIGLYRDHDTFKPVTYYCKLPETIASTRTILLDPMLATGGSAVAAIDYMKEKGAKDIVFMCLIASKQGIAEVQTAHPDVNIYAAACDEKLNDKAYILPGLGDAGDRLYGTK